MYSIPLIKPYLPKAVRQKLMEVLDSGHLTEGTVTAELEELVKHHIGVHHCIAVTSCTIGLELALRCLKIGKGDEVIVPAFTYPATADVVRIVGAEPVFADVDRQTMVVDYDQLEKCATPATRAIIPVSLFGNPLDYDRLNRIKRKLGATIIEDAACALSASFKGVSVGKLADITVFSLHPRKFVTTGEGGLVTTDNRRWADWMKSYKRFGMAAGSGGIAFERIGTNYKLSDILAAVGLVQMERIERLISKRRAQAAYYEELLNGLQGVSLPATTPHGEHAYQSFCVFVQNRDAILERMRAVGIEVQIGSYFLLEQPAFRKDGEGRPADGMPGCRRASEECLVLPLYHDMTGDDQERVVSALQEAIQIFEKS